MPGLDGALSANDSATFGNAISAPAIVSLNGANPSLRTVTFDSAHAYTLAQGTGTGALTLKGNGGPAAVTVSNGSHTVSAPLILATNAGVAVTHAADTLTVSGAISGNGLGITKSGDGALVLTGTSSYTGATSVTGGTLKVNGKIVSAATIASGATLTGGGTVGALANNGILDPGDLAVNQGIGDLAAIGNVSWNNGSTFRWQVGSVDASQILQSAGSNGAIYDQFLVNGKLTINTGAAFNVASVDLGTATGWNPAQDFSWTVASATGGITGIPSLIMPDVASGFNWDVNTNAGWTITTANGGRDLMLNYFANGIVVVPEPGTLSLLLLGALSLLGRRRRARQ